jgi:hypothetical protein
VTLGYRLDVTGRRGLLVVFVVYGLIASVAVYVMVGWLGHTLLLLIGIAYNTAESAGMLSAQED